MKAGVVCSSAESPDCRKAGEAGAECMGRHRQAGVFGGWSAVLAHRGVGLCLQARRERSNVPEQR